ncbi:hypothetical protein H2198_005570 [Neophaeococcomyces mojaviensis]|uniref:Uncharacterized protein n=1 Tax=Neophaeococcomyces mojaviensis TaxID=3383035 RepID=A0ACC3A588_9EURO|nr:hypothetical protein H2198_005570 [Knufia sp. JES_112]
MPIGPQLPPSTEKRKRNDDGESSDSSDDLGPQPLSTSQDESRTKKPRTIGPSLPSTGTTKGAQQPNDADDSDGGDSDDSDDDFGPSLPSKGDNAITNATQTQARTIDSRLLEPVSETQKKRDEWMTMAPQSSDWSQRVDPTKMKNRKFNTGRSNNISASGSDSWHETPEQKQARLQRQVLGTKGGEAVNSQSTIISSTAENDETAKRMKEYNKQRGPSLYDAHQKGHQVEEDDDPSARAFDRQKDMGAGLQLNATQRRDMLKKSANFNTRFSNAKYL